MVSGPIILKRDAKWMSEAILHSKSALKSQPMLANAFCWILWDPLATKLQARLIRLFIFVKEIERVHIGDSSLLIS